MLRRMLRAAQDASGKGGFPASAMAKKQAGFGKACDRAAGGLGQEGESYERILQVDGGRSHVLRERLAADDLRWDREQRRGHRALRVRHLHGGDHRAVADSGARHWRGRPGVAQEARMMRERRGSAEDRWRRPCARTAVRGGIAAAGGLALAAVLEAATYPRWRAWCLSWGATNGEAARALPGDELLAHPDIVSTRAVHVDAPPSAIWPWLVQMGPGRGGAYTYDWIERRLGIDIRNSDRIIPELQHLKVGDEIPMPGYSMRVERLDTEQAMVIRSSNHAWVWSFELRPATGHTRLISRNRFDTSAMPVKDLLALPVIELGSWLMERKMLLTVKQRAERLAQALNTLPRL